MSNFNNFAISAIDTAPTPNNTGTSLVVSAGTGSLFPDTPFYATIWPTGEQPTSENAEIVLVVSKSTDTFTVERAQEDTNAKNIIVGDQISAAITAQTLVEAENSFATWSPFIYSSAAATSLQTLASASGQSSSGSLFVFPVTVNNNIYFNQAILPVSMSYTTSNAQGSNSYYSYFGLYTMNASTALSLMATGSFSIAESMNGLSRTWSFPTTTNTSGYGYDTLAMSNTAQIVNYISGTRAVGMQFGSEMHLTNGIYYLGLMSLRSTANNSGAGVIISGVIGQIIDPPHLAGSVSGVLPIGSVASLWGGTNVGNSTQWWGRHMVAFVTATSLGNFGGTTVPDSINLSALGASAANSTATILPTVTFYSNVMST